PALDLFWQLSRKKLLDLFERVRILLDSGPGQWHMSNAVGLDVIGLHAATDSPRSGSYLNRALSVDYFVQAARRYRNATADTLPWGTRIENIEGIMRLIPVAAVTPRLDQDWAGNGMGARAEATASWPASARACPAQEKA